MSCITILRQLQCHLVMRNDNDEYELAMTHLMTAIVISGAMMVQLRNVRGAMMMLEGQRIKFFGFRPILILLSARAARTDFCASSPSPSFCLFSHNHICFTFIQVHS